MLDTRKIAAEIENACDELIDRLDMVEKISNELEKMSS